MPMLLFAQQSKDLPPSVLNITKTTEKISLDGVLDEAVWANAEKAGNFWQQFPYDTSASVTQTEVMMTYDDRNIYVAAICHDELEGNYVVQSLKRDWSYPKSDAFAVFLDPLSDQNNGFSFAVNPFGAQREGLVANGGSFGVTTIWDNRWFSAVENYDDKWIVEMAIPFKTLRYKSDLDTWRLNFSRNDLKRNESSSWVGVPRNMNIATMSFNGELKWDNPPKKAGANISLIPYVIGGVSKDYQADTDPELKRNIGLDAKVGITSSLNLDITINPDFSQVEVDRQVINTDRFSIFFPERRTFFIENSDLFANFGFSRIRPFFSRRIGLSNGKEVPIIAGLRLSGKINKNYRIGLMTMQTQGMSAAELDLDEGEPGLRSQNYVVAALQRQVFARSNIAAIFVNRQAFEGYKWMKDDYSRIVGLDFNIASKSDRLRGKLFFHQSLYPEQKRNAFANASWLQYTTNNVFVMWNHEYVGENYQADVGFVPRTSYWRLEPKFDYFFYPKKGKINNHGPNLYWNFFTDLDFKVTDNLIKFDYDINFQNKSEFTFLYREIYTLAFFAFDPSFSGGEELPEGTSYNYRNAAVKYTSDFRKKFFYKFTGQFGSYYNGNQLLLKGEIFYRLQPFGFVGIAAQRNEIRLPDPFNSSFFTLIGPEIELSLTKDIFFSTFIQYNTQADNININARFQWRFKPMSDLFIVYTDNYDPTNPFSVKNRSLVIKLNYWFTL